MADEDKQDTNNSEAGAETPAATETEVPAKESEADKQKKKYFRLFLLLTVFNVGFLSWLVYTMRFEVKKEKQEVIEVVEQDTTAIATDELDNVIPFEAFLVNVVARHKGKARHGQKVLRVRFEVVPESEASMLSLETNMPKLRDAINLLLSSQDYADLSMSKGREALRNLIKENINEVIQPNRIKKVYFTEFVIN